MSDYEVNYTHLNVSIIIAVMAILITTGTYLATVRRNTIDVTKACARLSIAEAGLTRVSARYDSDMPWIRQSLTAIQAEQTRTREALSLKLKEHKE